jgi:Tol biopolymer transport system component
MPLQPGARLGPYEIVSLLGAGGMGEVYRANDPRLHRQVAVKVLSQEMANDPTIRQRFEIEARAASNISHPNIVAVYDFGNQDGVLYIVWELVEGKPLQHEQMPLKKALDIAAQIADGISAAHDSGIVHRDLKPDNVLVTPDGRAKILDFGLAKRTGRGPLGDSNETIGMSTTQTRPGMIMGTIGYMSPEQVKGLEVDHRTDIFSFGLVLYELLGGKKAFGGDSAIAVLHGIVNQDPPDLPDSIPMPVKQVVAHCIEKAPEQRFQSARDLCFALRAMSGTNTRTGIQTSVFEKPKSGSKATLIVATVLGLAAVGAFFAGRMMPGGKGSQDFNFQQLTFRRGFVSGARFAPDGKAIAYSAAWSGEPMEVFSARVDTPESQKTGVSQAHVFSISKAGEVAIALNADFDGSTQLGKLARVPLVGGAPRELLNNVAEADWDPKGENLAVVVVNGGNQRRLEYPPGKVLVETSGFIRGIRFSPQGDKIAFFDHPIAVQHGGAVAVVDLAGKKTTLVQSRLSLEGLVWAKEGKEIWFGSAPSGEANRVEATDMDGKTHTVLSTPAGMKLQDISSDGSLLFTKRDDYTEMVSVPEGNGRPRNLSWFNASSPRQISADGKQILFTEFSQAAGHNHAVGLRGVDGSPVIRLGEGDALGMSPDGTPALARLHGRPPQFVMYTIGAGESKKFPASGVEYPMAAQFHPDGQSIIFEGGSGRVDRLWQQNLSSGQSRAFAPEGVSMYGQSVSPNGEFVCATGPDGKLSLYPIAGGAIRSLAGATHKDKFIRWNSDGKLIFVYDPHRIPVQIETLEVQTGKRTPFAEYTPMDATGIHYVEAVLTPDGKSAVYGLKRFLSSLQIVSGLQ